MSVQNSMLHPAHDLISTFRMHVSCELCTPVLMYISVTDRAMMWQVFISHCHTQSIAVMSSDVQQHSGEVN